MSSVDPCWAELYTTDPERAVTFYGELLGWTADRAAEEFGGYITFRKDAVLVVMGENGLAVLGDAIQASAGNAPLASGHVSLMKLVPLMKDEPRAEGFAKETFTKPGSDAITLKAQGGDSISIQIEAKASVLKFLAAMGNKK